MPPRAPKPSPATTSLCPRCGHRLVRVVTEAGKVLTLVPGLQTWVITPRRTREDMAIAVQSPAYVEHQEVCDI